MNLSSKPKKHERSLTDLSPKERKIILSIHEPKDIKSCEVVNTWSDDHIPCIGVKLNGVKMGFWWIGEYTGAFRYWDSAKAKEDIIECIDQAVDGSDHFDVDENECPEGLTKEELDLWEKGKEKRPKY